MLLSELIKRLIDQILPFQGHSLFTLMLMKFKINRAGIESWTSSNLGKILLFTPELLALEDRTHRLTIGKIFSLV